NTSLLCSLYLLQLLPPPTATLFPYTTLFRSKPPATAPNRDAGILNQLLLMNELTPPWAVITSEGYMLARAWRVCASAIRTLNSRSEEHTSELQSRENLVCRLLLVKKKNFNVC